MCVSKDCPRLRPGSPTLSRSGSLLRLLRLLLLLLLLLLLRFLLPPGFKRLQFVNTRIGCNLCSLSQIGDVVRTLGHDLSAPT